MTTQTIRFTLFALLAVPSARAEEWPALEDYVDDCVLIVKCETVVQGDSVAYKVQETWKGTYSPDLFHYTPPEGYLHTHVAHGNPEPLEGREIIFFFTRRNHPGWAGGKILYHSTAFPVTDGSVTYASTSMGMRKDYTVDQFRNLIQTIVMVNGTLKNSYYDRQYPQPPPIPTAIYQEISNEFEEDTQLKAAFGELDTTHRNVRWFEVIGAFEEAEAVHCLLACCSHYNDDVKIRAVRAIGRAGDIRAAAFLIEVARVYAVYESGSENATIHGVYQHAVADALNELTGEDVVLKSGQDPEGLKEGVVVWKEAILRE